MDDMSSYLESISIVKARMKNALAELRDAEDYYVQQKDMLDAVAYDARFHGASINSIAKALGVMDTRTAKNAINRGARKVSENGAQL